MAVSAILSKSVAGPTTVTITTAISNAAGRISSQADNTANKATRALVSVQFETGTSPTANAVAKIYLIRQLSGGTVYQDGRQDAASAADLGTADAAVSVEPVAAQLIGVMPVSATTNHFYEAIFQVYDPGPKFSFVFWNATGVALFAAPTIVYELFADEAQ